ncbi:GNAT family N-acetyltransferase [Nodosilinea nodulosa]|uniref:GNAT family N-acetyltransferase n=1 Tax=Nodosilinea nodulosa TaxID=416001 RepID=UPI0002D52CF2|nr:GNAT family N-acetyltransferase [Nodosilinea nodulosa]
MIRPAIAADIDGLTALAEATGLFGPTELKELNAMLANAFDTGKASQAFWLTDDDRGPVGVAYCEPERMTDQTWNLQLIAIHPDRQGQGRGTALLHHVEKTLVSRGGRMLIVETAATPEFERTRQFYSKCGYEKEGHIRDFYATGYDKVTFRKLLQPV